MTQENTDIKVKNKYIVFLGRCIKQANEICSLIGLLFIALFLVNARDGNPLTFIVNDKPYVIDLTMQPHITVLWAVFIFVGFGAIRDAIKFVIKIKKRWQ